MIKKLKRDLKDTITREPAVKLLIETFGDFISDAKFMGWLARKLDYYPNRSLTLINNYIKVFVPHNSLSANVLKEIYSFCVTTSIPRTDRRSSRDEIYVNKRKY